MHPSLRHALRPICRSVHKLSADCCVASKVSTQVGGTAHTSSAQMDIELETAREKAKRKKQELTC